MRGNLENGVIGKVVGFLPSDSNYHSVGYFFTKELLQKLGELHLIPILSNPKEHVDNFMSKTSELLAALDNFNFVIQPFYERDFTPGYAVITILLKSRLKYLMSGVTNNKGDITKLKEFLHIFSVNFTRKHMFSSCDMHVPSIEYNSQYSLGEENVKKTQYHLQIVESTFETWIKTCKKDFMNNLGSTFIQMQYALAKKDQNAGKLMIKLLLRAITEGMVNATNIDEFFVLFPKIQEYFAINLNLELSDSHPSLLNVISNIVNQSAPLSQKSIENIIKALSYMSTLGVDVTTLIKDLSIARHFLNKELLVPFAKIKNLGGTFLEIHPVLSALYSEKNFGDFVKLIELMSADSLPIYEEAKLDCNADYFSILLMNGFDYMPYVKKIIQEFSKYQQYACSMLFEAVSREDHVTAKSIINASTEAKINLFEESKQSEKTGAASYGLFAHEKLVVRAEQSETSFNLKLNFTVPEIYKYLIKKYKITADKQSLFYVHNASIMADFLCEIGGILDKKSSRYQELCAAFARDFNLSPIKQDDTSKNEELIEKVTKLEFGMMKLSEENAKLKEKNNELEVKIQQIESFLMRIPAHLVLEDQYESKVYGTRI